MPRESRSKTQQPLANTEYSTTSPPVHQYQAPKHNFVDIVSVWHYAKYASIVMAGAIALAMIASLPWKVQPGGYAGAAGICYQAADALRHGKNPYLDSLAWVAAHAPTAHDNLYINVFVYPLLLPILLLPLTLLPLSLFLVVWEVISVGCALYLAHVLVHIVFPKLSRMDYFLSVLIVLDVVLVFGPVRHSMRDPEVDIEIAALAVGAWQSLQKKHIVLSGIMLGIAIAVKPPIGILLVYHLWHRSWRAMAITLIVGATGIILPFVLLPHIYLASYQTTVAFWTTPGILLAPKSISLFGFFALLIYQFPAMWTLLDQPLVARAAMIVILALCFLVTSRRVPDSWVNESDQDVYVWSLSILVLLLGAPLVEDNHLVLALVPLAACIAPVTRRITSAGKQMWRIIAFCGAWVIYFSLPIRGVVQYGQYAGWRIFIAGYWLYGMLALAAFFFWIGRSAPFRTAGISVLQSGWNRAVKLATSLSWQK